MSYKEKTIKQFDTWSETYDDDIWSNYFKRANKKIFEVLKGYADQGSSILDLGAGTGQFVSLLSQYFNGEILAVDISPKMIAAAKNNNSGVKNIEYICKGIEELDIEKKFDIIVCMNSFHHYKDHEKSLNKIRGVLKEGGTFVLLDPFSDNPVRFLWNIILKGIFKEGDVKYFSRKELRVLAEKTKFKIISQNPFMYFTLITIFKREG